MIILFDFSKAFDSVNRDTMFHTYLSMAYQTNLLKKLKLCMAGNPTESLLIPNSATDSLQATSKILESNNLTPCFLIIAVDYKLQIALDLISNHVLTLPK